MGLSLNYAVVYKSYVHNNLHSMVPFGEKQRIKKNLIYFHYIFFCPIWNFFYIQVLPLPQTKTKNMEKTLKTDKNQL